MFDSIFYVVSLLPGHTVIRLKVKKKFFNIGDSGFKKEIDVEKARVRKRKRERKEKDHK